MKGDLYQPTLQAPAFGRTKKDLDLGTSSTIFCIIKIVSAL